MAKTDKKFNLVNMYNVVCRYYIHNLSHNTIKYYIHIKNVHKKIKIFKQIAFNKCLLIVRKRFLDYVKRYVICQGDITEVGI